MAFERLQKAIFDRRQHTFCTFVKIFFFELFCAGPLGQAPRAPWGGALGALGKPLEALGRLFGALEKPLEALGSPWGAI